MTAEPQKGLSGAKAGSAGLLALLLAIVASVFSVEGGYVNNPNDPGGATNWGITEATARAKGYTGSMRNLPKDLAERWYVEDYIEKPGFVPIVALDFAVGEELVDSGVNAGPARASCWLQESLNHLNNRGRDWPEIAEDCRIGDQTVAAYRALQKRRGDRFACELVLKLMDGKQVGHYTRIAGRDGRLETFMAGWLRLRIENVDRDTCGSSGDLSAIVDSVAVH